MMLALTVALLFGPPKLPPMPGRAVPIQPAEQAEQKQPEGEQPHAQREQEGRPAPHDDGASSPLDGSRRRDPSQSARSQSAPSSRHGDAETGAAKAAESKPTGMPTSGRKEGETPGLGPVRVARGPEPKSAAHGNHLAAVSLGGAMAMRDVSVDEVAGWDAADRAAAPRGTPPSNRKPKDVGPAPLERSASEEVRPSRLTFRRRPYPPERTAAFVLGYRYFRLQDALARAQDWHVASLEVTPLRRYVRANLVTEFGIEGGPAARHGDRADLFLMERLGLGVQYPHFVTPLIEFQGGVGGARVELFQRNDLVLLYTLGLDAGAQWAVTKWMFFHCTIGWIRPTFVWRERSAAFDRFTFKVGVGF